MPPNIAEKKPNVKAAIVSSVNFIIISFGFLVFLS